MSFMQQMLQRPSLLGAIFAVLVGAVAYLYLGSGSEGDDGAGVAIERVPVLTARILIPQRAPITAADVEVRMMPAEGVHPDALDEVEDIEGQYSGGVIRPGEQILRDDISPRPGGGHLAQLIPEGSRAVSLAVSDVIAVGGLIEPGDHVDVIAVFEENRAGTNSAAQILQDVEILAVSRAVIGADPAEAEEGRRSSVTSLSATVTLSVSAYQAQLLALADEFASLRLVLRRPDDETPSSPLPVDLNLLVVGR
jgi:pilus assembly protein CpaB